MQISVPIIVGTLSITDQETIIYLSVFSFALALIIVLFLMKPDMKTSPTRNGSHIGSIILWSILGVFMAYFAQWIAVTIEFKLFKTVPGSENTQNIMEIARMLPIFMIIPAIIAPILEEIIFRKIIFGAFYKKTNFFIAAILSSAIFVVIHGEPAHLLIYTAIGYVFALLYVQKKQIIVHIIVHMTLNSITVLVQYFFDVEDLENIQKNMEQMQFIFGG